MKGIERFFTAFFLSAKQQGRSTITLALLLLVPSVFFAVTALTTDRGDTVFKLASIDEKNFVTVDRLEEALTFMALVSVGVLASFLGMTSLQRDFQASRRLVNSGFPPHTLLLGRYLLLTCLGIMISLFVLLILRLFFSPNHMVKMFTGFYLLFFIYSAYGMLVGALARRQLEGILLIVLLANIDIGWLQNPLFYADALNKAIIRFLPAFFPTQVAMISAFTDGGAGKPFLLGIAYGTAFLILAGGVWWVRLHHGFTRR